MVANDVRDALAVSRVGRGRPLVLAHGLGCDQTVWSQLIEAWARDHEVITFDYTGCGRATRPRDPERYGVLDGYVQDLVDVLESVGQPAAVIGHSVSGSIGLLAAVARPALFDRLVMLAPSPRFLDDPATDYIGGFSEADIAEVLALIDRNFVDWAGSFAQTVAPTTDGAARMKAGFFATERASFRSFATVAFRSDVRASLSKMTVPTLLVQSSCDPIAPVAVGRYMHAAMPASQLRIVDVPGHCPHITAPDVILSELREFLDAA